MFKDHLIFSNNLQDAANQIRLHEAMSQKLKDETKALLDQIAKMDADRAARENKVNPITGKTPLDVSNEAFKEYSERERRKENFDELAKTAPGLAARARFRSQSIAQSAAPGAVTGVAGQGGSTKYSDLHALSTLSAEDQERVIPTLRHKQLEDMVSAQSELSQNAVDNSRGKTPLGASKVNALNLIHKTIDSRKNNAMGGKAAAASFVRSWQEDPTGLRTQKSMEVRTPRERLAMLDAFREEGLRQFRENGKLDPNHIKALNQFAKSDKTPFVGFSNINTKNENSSPQVKTGQEEKQSSSQTLTNSGKSYAQMRDEQRANQTSRLLGIKNPGTRTA